MCVISRVLIGDVNVQSYDWVDRTYLQARNKETRVLEALSTTFLLAEEGNIHEV
jgi:hypothetical protein